MGAASVILGSGSNIRIRTMPIARSYEAALFYFQSQYDTT